MGCNVSQKINYPTDLQQENKSKSLCDDGHTSLGQMSIQQSSYPRMLPDAYLALLCTAINRAFFLKDDDWRKNTQFASEHDLELKCVYQFMYDKVQNQTLNPKIPYVISFELSKTKKKFIFAVLGEINYFSVVNNLQNEPELLQLKEFQKYSQSRWYNYHVENDFAFFSKTPFFRISFEIKETEQQLTSSSQDQKFTRLKTLFSKIYKSKSSKEIESMLASNQTLKVDVFSLNENIISHNILSFTNIMQDSEQNDLQKELEIFGQNPEIQQIEVYELNFKASESIK